MSLWLVALVSIADAAERPNMVLIMADDQGYRDMSCHGNPWLKTPNLDRLAAEGVQLEDYNVDPVCTPTRAALMTGRYSAPFIASGHSQERSKFFGQIVNFDEKLGRLLDCLESQQLSENTIVIFMGDNGTAKGAGGGDPQDIRMSLANCSLDTKVILQMCSQRIPTTPVFSSVQPKRNSHD